MSQPTDSSQATSDAKRLPADGRSPKPNPKHFVSETFGSGETSVHYQYRLASEQKPSELRRVSVLLIACSAELN